MTQSKSESVESFEVVCAELPEAVLVVWLDTAAEDAVAVFEDTALADAFEELTAGACELLEGVAYEARLFCVESVV